MHLRQSIPYLKDMMVDKKKGIIFFGLGLANYINYGIRYYLQGIFSKEQFIQYIGEVRSHGNAYKDEIEKLSEAFDVDIRPISTLDGLKFYSYTPEEMIEYFHNNKITNESTLTDMFIKELRKLPGLIGRYYKNLTKSQKEELDNSSKKLLTLNYIDYVGVVEYARTLSMGLLDKNALSFYPFEEGHIIKRHAKLYTPTCSITWLPFFIPQSTILSKLFYQTYDIQLFNALIQNGAIALLSKMVYAIASQHPVLYLKTKDEIEKLVVSVGCSVDELNDSLVVSNKISH